MKDELLRLIGEERLAVAEFGKEYGFGVCSHFDDAERLERWGPALVAVFSDAYAGLSAACAMTGSPIEELMAIALWRADGWGTQAVFRDGAGRVAAVGPQVSWGSGSFDVEPQHKAGPYTLDFLLRYELNGDARSVAVECDGHDFHEKTKHQAAHDKKRDRYFASAGIPVLRFTGSEIHRNPTACANEALRLLFLGAA